MEDIIGLIVMAAIMIAGVVSSANKKKKAAEAAGRELQTRRQQEAGIDTGKKQGGFIRKSLDDMLEELTKQGDISRSPRPQAAPDYYYDREISSAIETAADSAAEYYGPDSAARNSATGRFRSDSAAPRNNRIAAVSCVEVEPEASESSIADDILHDFDLRRAVIESEVLQPKFKQY